MNTTDKPKPCPRCGSRHSIMYRLDDGQWMKRCKDCRKEWQSEPPPVFNAEPMVCCMCGKQQISDPAKSSNWRHIKADDKGYYVCTDHFPPDGSSAAAFKTAYLQILSHILKQGVTNE